MSNFCNNLFIKKYMTPPRTITSNQSCSLEDHSKTAVMNVTVANLSID